MSAPHGQPTPPAVDYAEPARVPASRRGPRLAGATGSAPRWLRAGCWVAAAALAVPLVLPLLAGPQTGADSPEEAVDQLLQGIADLDAAAIVAAVDPDETDDPSVADSAYQRLRSVRRVGDEVPPDVTAVLNAAEAQVGGQVDRRALATLAAVDIALDDLELDAGPPGSDGTVQVAILDGVLGVTVDPSRLPDEVDGLDPATYDMPLVEGWRARDVGFEPFLTTVERDGRWYVSLDATADDILGATS
ncbi:hypothetical protein GCM10023340_07780 [Nocardioides marinquilinus]|uniref:DUF2939 domain-containing protein n=1 Tax=Nocardioides marinquilinus TaxID=1210400 RepID=A0ABP9P9Y4_9ACTN